MMSQDPEMNPYAGADYASHPAPSAAETNIPKWIGVLNIVFASLLLLCLLGYALQLLMQGFLSSAMKQNQQQMQEMLKQEREDQLEQLQESEDAAESEEEAAEIREEREELEQQPVPRFPDMQNLAGMKNPAVMGSYIFDVGTGILLNVLMLAAGIGLLSQRAWARKLGVWVAGLKVLRLVVVCALTMLVIGPAISEGMGNFLVEMEKMNPGGPQQLQPQAQQIKTIYTTMFAVWAIILLVLGSIYPIICLRLLTRPHVIAACKQTKEDRFQPETF